LFGQRQSVAAAILSEVGITDEELRACVANLPPSGSAPSSAVDKEVVDAAVEAIKSLLEELSRADPNTLESEDLVDEVSCGRRDLIVHRQALFLVDVVDPVQLLGVLERRWPD